MSVKMSGLKWQRLIPRHKSSHQWSVPLWKLNNSRGIGSLGLNPTIGQVLKSSKLDENVTVNGWIRSVRKLKNVAFADLSDGSTPNSLMVVMTPDQVKGLATGSCVEISGKLVESQGNQQFEINTESLRLLGPATSDYPLQKKFHTPEFLRSIPEFRWRTRSGTAVLKYRSAAISWISQFFASNDFVQVNSPLITSSDCEGAGEVFQIQGGKAGKEFFGKNVTAYLTVSSQLHLEVFSGALNRVWNMTPAFRAEASDTNRHLSEFWMVETEVAFVEKLEQIMTLAEAMVKSSVSPLLEESNELRQWLLSSKRDQSHKDELIKRWHTLGDSTSWPRISYTEAVEILNTNANELSAFGSSKDVPPSWGQSLSSAHERYLSSEYFKSAVFITDYPSTIKPFYMKLSHDQKTAQCFDLIVPHIGELIGGSLREDDYESLTMRVNQAGMNQDIIKWYLELRRHGSFPHGGYGMGFERLLCYVCGVENIRDVVGFPRWSNSCVC